VRTGGGSRRRRSVLAGGIPRATPPLGLARTGAQVCDFTERADGPAMSSLPKGTQDVSRGSARRGDGQETGCAMNLMGHYAASEPRAHPPAHAKPTGRGRDTRYREPPQLRVESVNPRIAGVERDVIVHRKERHPRGRCSESFPAHGFTGYVVRGKGASRCTRVARRRPG